uniref:Uncharacterized protein n=1 Tax=Alexandrium andersonii TaxID=327968 RepID=A0A7S2CID9_9DINO|mmetsp:Transcript_39401/g.89574  ORF Transcript_39401/g.89574 Transcript_39401/m.89574 type:complete len:319 (+) Transcript_39401:68-1024(+)
MARGARLLLAALQSNFVLLGSPIAMSHSAWAHQSCWSLLEYNTDKFLSSTVYQNQNDGRCVLAFSGYHGALAGYTRGTAALVWPPQTWNICGQDMYAPYVRLLRHHFSLANWSKLVHTFAGPAPVCKGELVFAAESMGGSAGEMLATCANNDMLHELMDENIPSFQLQTLYTYGASAASTKPMFNSLRKDGCFKGKRIYLSKDPVAQFGAFFNLKHPRMDAVEIWANEQGKNPSVRAYPCGSDEAITDMPHEKPPPVVADLHYNTAVDKIQHEVTTYAATIDWMQKAGKGSVFEEALLAESPSETNAEKYLNHLQQSA